MLIKKINIDEYGALSGREFILDEGMNIIEGNNESGKSTILSFIRFMLYGMPRKSGAITERDRGISWGRGVAGGSMVVSLPDKNGELCEYRIERHGQLRGAKGHENYAETFKIIDLATGTEVFDGQEPGRALLGLSQETFVSTAFIRQLECADVDGTGVNDSIENLLFAANEGINTEKAMSKLDDIRKELLYKNEKGGLIFDLEAQKLILEEKLTHAKSQAEEIIAKEASITAAKVLEAELGAKLRDGENAANLYEACSILHRFDELHHHEEQRDRLKYELTELCEEKGYEGDLPTRDTVADTEALLRELADNAATATMGDAELAKANNAADGDRTLAAYADTVEAEGGCETLISRFTRWGKKAKKDKGLAVASFVGGGLIALVGVLFMLFGLSFETPILDVSFFVSLTEIIGGAILPLLGGSAILFLVLCGVICALGIGLIVLGILLALASKKAWAVRNEMLSDVGLTNAECSPAAYEKHLALCFENREKCRTYNDGVAKATGHTDSCRANLDTCIAKCLSHLEGFGLTCDEITAESVSAALKNTVEILSALCREAERIENEIAQLSAIISSLSESLREYNEKTLRSAIGNTDIEKILSSYDIESIKQSIRFHKEQQSAAAAKRVALEKEFIALTAAAENPAKLAAKLDETVAQLGEAKFRYQSVIMAMEAIESASDSLRRSVTPKIREKAGAMMERITDGKYAELGVAPDMSVSIFAGNSTRSIDALSKGTRDAAYLSLRMALAELVSPTHPLPLTMDEGLSLLDEGRAKRVLSLLYEHTQSGAQCVLFTCHKREAELMREIGKYQHILLS